MNRGSTIGKNMNYIMWKYEVHQRCVVGHMPLLTSSSQKATKITDDDINASIIAECIKIRDDTKTCDTMNKCDANDIVMYLTTM